MYVKALSPVAPPDVARMHSVFAWRPQIAARAKQWKDEKRSVFTNAYIIPMLGKNGAKADCVCQAILAPLWESKVLLPIFLHDSCCHLGCTG